MLKRMFYMHAALAIGIAVGTGLAHNWDGVYLVMPLMAWFLVMPFGSSDPLDGWKPRYDPEGKVYMWVKPEELVEIYRVSIPKYAVKK